MITREDAVRQVEMLVAARHGCELLHYARTVVAMHDEVERLRVQAEHSAMGKQALIDEIQALHNDLTALRLAAESAERSNAEVELLRADLDDHVKAEVVAGEVGPDESGDLYITVRVPLAQNRAFPMGAVLRVLRAAVPGSV